MMNTTFILSLLGHILGDFYFQPAALAQAKRSRFSALLLHGLLYAIPLAALFFLTDRAPVLFWSLASLAAAHLLIDWLKQLLQRSSFWQKRTVNRPSSESSLFFIDQTAHILTILILYLILDKQGFTLQPAAWLASISAGAAIPLSAVLQWTLLILLVLKPASFTIVQLTNRYKPIQPGQQPKKESPIETADNDTAPNIQGAGQMIGWLERLLIVLFLAAGQYAAIGLIMTAKSVARYEKITKDSAFAEYYLIGTLSSILLALLSYLFIFGF